MLDVCLLGTGGMTPLPGRALTSLMVRCEGSGLLIDCGEGTQVALKKAAWSPKAIDIMCFTHFHADHVAGLPGMLLNMANSDRFDPVIMLGPKGLFNVVKSLRCIAPMLPFELRFIELDQNTEEYKLGPYLLKAFKVKHQIPCFGYSLYVPRKGRFDPEKAKNAGIPLQFWNRLQNGETVRDEKTGKEFRPEIVMGPERRGIKITYTTDTRPCDNIIKAASGADLFICEGMYGDPNLSEKARDYMHCTMQDAVRMAKMADPNPSELWLTHFSPSVNKPTIYLEELKKSFPNVRCGKDGLKKKLAFEDPKN